MKFAPTSSRMATTLLKMPAAVATDRARVLGGQAVTQQVLDLEAGLHQVADVHDQQDHEGALDARQRDVQYLLEAARAVDAGGLIQGGVDGGHGGDVDDGAPADLLPDVDDAHQPPEVLALAQPEHGLESQHLQQVVDGAVGREDVLGHGHDDDHGQEVGQVGDGLHRALEGALAHLVQQHRQYDGGHRAEHQVDDAHGQRVADGLVEIRAAEQPLEVVQAVPGRDATGDQLAVAVVLEGVGPAPQGNVVEQQHVQENRHGHQCQLPLTGQRSKEALVLLADLAFVIRRHRGHAPSLPIRNILRFSKVRPVARSRRSPEFEKPGGERNLSPPGVVTWVYSALP